MFNTSLGHIRFSCLDVCFILFAWSCLFWIQIRKIAENVAIKSRTEIRLKVYKKLPLISDFLWKIVLIDNYTSKITSLNDFLFLPIFVCVSCSTQNARVFSQSDLGASYQVQLHSLLHRKSNTFWTRTFFQSWSNRRD